MCTSRRTSRVARPATSRTAGTIPKLLRAKNENQLCLECHGPDAAPAKLEKEHLVTIFDGKVKLPEDYFRKVPILPLKYGLGHPTTRHPVQDVMDPATNQVVTPISCASCHQPHASAKPGLLVKDQANNMDFCKTCHANGLDLKQYESGRHIGCTAPLRSRLSYSRSRLC